MSETQEIQADEAVLDLLMQEYAALFPDEEGIHIETMLTILGALAGFGCQMGIREALIKTGQEKEEDLFVIAETTDGQRYYFGDFLNHPLLSAEDDQVSVWSLVAGAAQSVGATELPDVNDIATFYAETVGADEFFMPQLPEEHLPMLLPVNALDYWVATQDIQIQHNVDPLHWGWTYALAAQNLIIQTQEIIDPALAAQIVMEAAIPMSKMSPNEIEGA